MQTRPATTDDIAAIADLQARQETVWFGGPEESPDEVRERIGQIKSLADNSLLVLDGDRVTGVALRWRTDTTVLADPDGDQRAVYELLVPWMQGGTPSHIDALSGDDTLRELLEQRGWRHAKSSFELLRDVTPDLEIAPPRWPDGVRVEHYREQDAAAAYQLIYVDAAWTDVPGHPHRDYDEWREIFISEHTLSERQSMAWRGDRLVGVSMGRTWDDGTGWVSQLAVARDERGRGLGRALLHDSLRNRIEGGASALGLSVQAENRQALQMYLDAGLEIDREWMQFEPPA